MTSSDTWARDSKNRLKRVGEEYDLTVPSTSHPHLQSVSLPSSPSSSSPSSPSLITSSCESSPLVHENPEFATLDFDPITSTVQAVRMPSLREENGQVNGTQGTPRPTNITYPDVAEGKSADFEMRGGFFHQLPKFHGLSGEDPNRHLQQFEFCCDTMCPRGADLQLVKMKAFPFSLEDRARGWFFAVPVGRITSWETMMSEFLLKYFPSSRVTQIRKEITSIKQDIDEPFDVYYERYKALVASCPNHGIREGLLLQYFYEGLRPMERQFLDSAAGGSLMEKSREDASNLLEMRATNNQQFGSSSTRRVNETSILGESSIISELKEDLGKLTLMVSNLAKGKEAQVCGVCSMEGHPADQCNQVIGGGFEEVNAIGFGGQQGGFQGQGGQQRFQNFNPRFNDPNFRWSNNNVLNPQQITQQGQQPSGGQYAARPQGQFMPRPYVPYNQQGGQPSGPSNYDEIFKNIATSTQSLLATTQTNTKDIALMSKDITELKTQMGQVVDFMGKFNEQGKLPGGVIRNPRNEQVQAIITRSGKTLVPPVSPKGKKTKGLGVLDLEDNDVYFGDVGSKAAEPRTATKSHGDAEHSVDQDGAEHVSKENKGTEPSKGDLETMIKRNLEKDPATSKKESVPISEAHKGKNSNSNELITTNHSSCLPFPSRFSKSKKEKSDEEVLEVFRKVNVNLPLLECIRQIPKYAKFLKELCTTRRHTRETQVVKMSETVSAILQRKMPPKMKDPGSFNIPCVIGSTRFEKVMLDLGASINVMPYNVYQSLGLGPLKTDNVVIQLADHSNKYPEGYVEDVLVQVNQLIFPADFYVLEMEESSGNSPQLLLGRPFMRTARTRIDVAEGNLTMEFDGEVIKFNVFDAMRYPIADLKEGEIEDVVEVVAQCVTSPLQA